MRYTAKARMLSFDFLPDDVVYGLPLVSVALLAGMIARADNLGRLPGEPDVLLAFLFHPKRPRADVTVGDVDRLLLALASSNRIAWYEVAGTRYVQFKNWDKNQPGIRPHSKKSTYPGREQASAAVPLVGDTMPLPLDVSAPISFDVAALVKGVAKQHTMQRANMEFDSSLVSEWVKADPARGGPGEYALQGLDWLRFAQWLWNTGTKRMPDVMHVLDECWRLQPSNPYAYFNAKAGTRGKVQAVMNAREAERESESFKKLDKEVAGEKDTHSRRQ